MSLRALATACFLVACGSNASNDATSAPGTADGGACAAGEIEVTSCGGDQKACVAHAAASTGDEIDRAQKIYDNPCCFGTQYSARCEQITPGHVSCACF